MRAVGEMPTGARTRNSSLPQAGERCTRQRGVARRRKGCEAARHHRPAQSRLRTLGRRDGRPPLGRAWDRGGATAGAPHVARRSPASRTRRGGRARGPDCSGVEANAGVETRVAVTGRDERDGNSAAVGSVPSMQSVPRRSGDVCAHRPQAWRLQARVPCRRGARPRIDGRRNATPGQGSARPTDGRRPARPSPSGRNGATFGPTNLRPVKQTDDTCAGSARAARSRKPEARVDRMSQRFAVPSRIRAVIPRVRAVHVQIVPQLRKYGGAGRF